MTGGGAGALAALAAAGALAALAGADATAQRAVPAGRATHHDSAVAMAQSLAAAPEFVGGGAGIVRTPIQARAVSAARVAAIPLPPGGNFNGIEWEAAGGPITAAQLEQTLEYNAICQWVRAAHARRRVDVARAVLAVVDRWPAVAPDANRPPGQPLGTEMLLRECLASHRREAAYARALGLPPSS